MGLTCKSTGISTIREMINMRYNPNSDVIVALAGNPNTGKSTVFNSLTGMNQHTGNWTGKTVATAQGSYRYNGKNFILVDLPGTYSLLSSSVEEEIARDFICFAGPHVTVVVADATCLERNLILVLQILEMTGNVVLCVNLMDEARRKNISIDLQKLSEILGIPVVGTSARNGKGLDTLMETVSKMANGEVKTNPIAIKYDEKIENAARAIEKKAATFPFLTGCAINLRWLSLKILDDDPSIISSVSKYLKYDIANVINLRDYIPEGLSADEIRDLMVSGLVELAEKIYSKVVTIRNEKADLTGKIDDILTSRTFGIPVMIGLLGLILWITIEGANLPSELLSKIFFSIETKLTEFFTNNNLPDWLHGALIQGVYRTLAWVVSVMLPPMAIFFPLFTLLEDLGYLPRVAFNLDNFFKKACAHGKQALTMCMGFGCNAAGVVGCRIIDSPRERLIAIITNNFVPCNGRFPILIAISSIFLAGSSTGFVSSIIGMTAITAAILLGIFFTFLISKILSKTILKGIPSSFALELPPYRKPQIGKILIRSIFDRTIFVLGRAAAVAAPAGLVIWCMANIDINGFSLLDHCAGFLDPFANLLGLDGYILMAFILGLPANEIVIPIIIMSYMASGSMAEIENLEALKNILTEHGWTWLTAVNVMLLCLMHFPCATTLLTIRKETKSWKWTLISFLVPTLAGIVITFVVTQIVRLAWT